MSLSVDGKKEMLHQREEARGRRFKRWVEKEMEDAEKGLRQKERQTEKKRKDGH